MKRIDLMRSYIKERSVLDVGCIDHYLERTEQKNWLHDELRKIAGELIGMDYLEKEVEILKSRGYNMILGNAENFQIPRKFDVIVAAELMEHLSSPGHFLECVKKHLNTDGKLIITTPNVFSLGNILRIIKMLINRRIKTDNAEHVGWYNKQNLIQLAERHGYKMLEFKTFYPERYNRVWDRMPFSEVKSKIFAVFCLK